MVRFVILFLLNKNIIAQRNTLTIAADLSLRKFNQIPLVKIEGAIYARLTGDQFCDYRMFNFFCRRKYLHLYF